MIITSEPSNFLLTLVSVLVGYPGPIVDVAISTMRHERMTSRFAAPSLANLSVVIFNGTCPCPFNSLQKNRPAALVCLRL